MQYFTGNRRNLRPVIVTIILVALCVLVFLLETFMGGSENNATLLNLGAMNNYLVIVKKQWWRLFTAQFLHIGILHLVSNIVMIYYMGMMTERMLGHFTFLLVYLLSGVGGNLLSLAFGKDNSIGAGASTALFGLFGAVIALGLRHRDNPAIAYVARQALILAILNLGIDLFLPGIDTLGHLGGLISGFLLAFIFNDQLGNKISNKTRIVALAVLIFYVVFTIRQGMVISF